MYLFKYLLTNDRCQIVTVISQYLKSFNCVQKNLSTSLFKNIIDKMCLEIIYIYIKDLALNNPQCMIYPRSCNAMNNLTLKKQKVCSLFYLQAETRRRKGQEVLFTNPSARAGYDTRSIFKRSLTGFEFRVFLLLD